MKSRIKLEMNELNRLIFDALDGMRYVEIRCKDITGNFQQIETEIRKREEDLKKLLIDQTNTLIAEVNDQKLELLKKYEMVMQDFQNQKEHWESLISMSLNGLDSGNCSKLTHIAKDLSVKTRSFVRRPLKLGKHEPISFVSEGQPDFKIGTIKEKSRGEPRPVLKSCLVSLILAFLICRFSTVICYIYIYYGALGENYCNVDSCSHNGSIRPAACPSDFSFIRESNKCYKIDFIKSDWNHARESCQNLHPNAHLVTVDDETEQKTIANWTAAAADAIHERCFLAEGSFVLLWTAGQRIDPATRSRFVWKQNDTSVDGFKEFHYTAWMDGEPNYFRSSESCVSIAKLPLASWNDAPCSTLMCVLCEIDL